ncbi:MAG: STAS domain-containing protein [Saprospiraceae bacterium]
MKFALDNQEKYTVLSVMEKNLNTAVAPNLKSEFVILRNKGVENLILNLADVEFVDSSGLSSILTAERLWKAEEGSFILTGVEHESVKKLIEITRLNSVLTIIPTLQESIDYVLMEEIERELNADNEE